LTDFASLSPVGHPAAELLHYRQKDKYGQSFQAGIHYLYIERLCIKILLFFNKGDTVNGLKKLVDG